MSRASWFSPRAVLVVLSLCSPLAANAADTPWSFELNAGGGTARQWMNKDNMNFPAASRVVIAEKETITQASFGSVGGTVRYRLQDRLDAFARIDWQDSQDLDQRMTAAFSNGDKASFIGTTLQEVQQTWGKAGVRWSQPVAANWSTEITADIRHFDNIAFDEYPASGLFPAMTVKTHTRADGAGLGLGLRYRLGDAWSALLGGEYAHVGDFAATAYGLSLTWHIR